MRRRDLLRSGVLAGAGTLAAPMFNRGQFQLFAGTRRYCARTIDLVAGSVVIDMLGLVTLDWQKLDTWHTDPDSFDSKDFDKLRASGITIFHPAVELNDPAPRKGALEFFTKWNNLLENRPSDFVRVCATADLERAKREGKVGVLLGLQNSNHFESVDDIGLFYALGQRVSQLTYNDQNLIGCGCGNRRDTGLTQFGAEIVSAMNRSGMAVDVSHAGERTTLDAIEASNKPVLITHSNCLALVPHPRCKSDAVIRAMAARGSVMGLTGIRAFVSRKNSATLQDLLDHYDHVTRIAGVEHVGIGSDTDPDGRDTRMPRSWYRMPIEITGVNRGRRIFDLTEGLIRRGYTDADIRLILGGNVLRVLGNIFDVTPGQNVPSNS